MIVADFVFEQEACESGLIQDSHDERLIGYIEVIDVECLEGGGIRRFNGTSGLLKASEDMTEISKVMSTSNFSVELWLSFDYDSIDVSDYDHGQMLFQTQSGDESNPMISPAVSLAADLIDVHQTLEAGFQSEVVWNNMILSGWLSTEREIPNYGQNKSHVVMTLGALDSEQTLLKLYVNGEILTDEVDDDFYNKIVPRLAGWSESDKINLLRNTGVSNSVWTTRLYSFALWNCTLTEGDITARLAEGPPNSLPIVYDERVHVKQNGEVEGDHSDDAAYYSTAIPAEDLATISLRAYDYDDTNRGGDDSLRIQITRLPSNGAALYQSNGSKITQILTEVPRSASHGGNFTVRFRPPHNVVSNFTSNDDGDVWSVLSTFTFRAVDARDTRVTSLINATVSVVVVPVNQPPLPSNTSVATVLAGRKEVLPALNGTDTDNNILNATITSIPTQGKVYNVFSNGTMATSPLSAGATLSNFRVAYLYEGSQNELLSTVGEVGRDSFQFTLTDEAGFTSIQARYNLSATVSLFATKLTTGGYDHLVVEGEQSLLQVAGKDLSDAQRDLCVRVLQLPKAGSLLDPFSFLLAITEGTSLNSCFNSSGYTGGITLGYTAPSGFFTTPAVSWNSSIISSAGALSRDSFVYSVFSEDGAISANVTHFVEVQNRNDATEVSFHVDSPIFVRPMTYTRGNTKAIISGFTLVDPDHDVDIVRAVLVSSEGARLTLNSIYLPDLDFTSAEFCQAQTRWQCKGSGYYEDEMSFLGTPTQVSLALNGLQYQINRANLVDNVTLSIYDGAGGGCLDDRGQSASVRIGCFERNLTFSVNVLGYDSDTDDSIFGEGQRVDYSRAAYIILGVILVCLCLCLRQLYRLVMKCCYRRENEGHGKEDLEEQEGKRERMISDTHCVSNDTLDLDQIYPECPEMADMSSIDDPDSPVWWGVRDQVPITMQLKMDSSHSSWPWVDKAEQCQFTDESEGIWV